jgi:hypothetical protein
VCCWLGGGGGGDGVAGRGGFVGESSGLVAVGGGGVGDEGVSLGWRGGVVVVWLRHSEN